MKHMEMSLRMAVRKGHSMLVAADIDILLSSLGLNRTMIGLIARRA